MRIHQICLVVLLSFSSAAIAAADAVEADPDATASWEAYCDRLKEAGAQILATYPQPSEIDRAEGLRYLAQQVAASLEQELIAQPGEIGLLRVGATTLRKWGLDAADAKYLGAEIDPKGSYRLFGTQGSARLTAVQTASMSPRYRAFGSMTAEDFQADAAGVFEVMLSQARPEAWDGPWLELQPDSTALLIREYFGDWEGEQPGAYFLVRVDAAPPGPPLSKDAAGALLMRSAERFASRAPQWLDRLRQARQHLVNRIRIGSAGDGGLQANVYGNGYFRLAADEAAVIEIERPEARLWSVQLGNIWWESLDYVNRTGSINGDQAVPGSDGRYRIVIAHQDPSVPNWLDTGAHPEGMILLRYQLATTTPAPAIRVVKFSDLGSALPADTPMVSEDERARDIAGRRAHIARRWAP